MGGPYSCVCAPLSHMSSSPVQLKVSMSLSLGFLELPGIVSCTAVAVPEFTPGCAFALPPRPLNRNVCSSWGGPCLPSRGTASLRVSGRMTPPPPAGAPPRPCGSCGEAPYAHRRQSMTTTGIQRRGRIRAEDEGRGPNTAGGWSRQPQ